MRSTAFFKLYKICILLRRCNLKIFAKNRFENSAIFVKIQQNFCKCCKIKNLQNVAIFQKLQRNNLVDFEKCCKTRICLQKSVPIQPKTSNILPKFCQKLATTLRVRPVRPGASRGRAYRRAAFLKQATNSKIGKFLQNLQILQIFGGLVLGCIKTKFCKKICVRQHFSSSTRFAFFCTDAISKF